MLSDQQLREAEAELELIKMEKELGLPPRITDGHNLEYSEPGAWSRFFFPDRLTRPFTIYQQEFWEWEMTVHSKARPRPRVECEPRGVGKSTNARALAVKQLATKNKKYVLYVSATDNQAQKHFNAIRSMLESDKLLKSYPHLFPQVQKHRPNIAKSWSSDRLVTKDDQVVEFISLLGNARGFTTEEGKRPDLIILDDIDEAEETPHMVKKKLNLLRYSIIPAKAENTLILFPQNLIHRDSICQQIRDQRADILSDRVFVGPFPLMKWYEAEQIEVEGDETGAKKWIITDGEVFDEALDIPYCEQLLNDGGRDSFDRECQQEVLKVGSDKDFREWDETVHLITYDEFREFWAKEGVNVWDQKRQRPIIPHNWNVGEGFDWGTTPEHPSAVVYCARPNETSVLSDSFFVFAETVLPIYPIPSHADIPLVSPGRVAEAIQATHKRWNVQESQIKLRLMSHEASAALNTMAVDLKPELKVFFGKWKPRRGSGVPQIQNLLEIDYTKNHPFRRCPTGHPHAGKPLKGCPRIFFLAPKKQGRLLLNALGKLSVAQPMDASGLARLRFEMPIYSHLNTGQDKIDDDAVDGLRGLMNVFGVQAKKPSTREELDKRISDKLNFNPEEAEVMTPAQDVSHQMAKQFALREMKKEGRPVDEFGDDVEYDWEDLSDGW